MVTFRIFGKEEGAKGDVLDWTTLSGGQIRILLRELPAALEGQSPTMIIQLWKVIKKNTV